MAAPELAELADLVRQLAVVHGRVTLSSGTTGASALIAMRAVQDAGARVVGVATVVDRATGAAEPIEAEGVPYRSVLGLADLGLS